MVEIVVGPPDTGVTFEAESEAVRTASNRLLAVAGTLTTMAKIVQSQYDREYAARYDARRLVWPGETEQDSIDAVVYSLSFPDSETGITYNEEIRSMLESISTSIETSTAGVDAELQTILAKR